MSPGANMNPRFVVVPAIPVETETVREGGRFYCKTAPIEFNLYDNQDKQRLAPNYPSRQQAEDECQRLNTERLQSILDSHLHLSKA